jgi:hypothetical protein
MITDLRKTPWPWFGGKSAAAEAVWEALGDVAHYVEPFAGSLAVLLRRPHEANRSYYSETVNDLDGLLVNAWRSMQMSPQATADAASWPVSEADLHARHIAIVRWKQERNLEHLMGDPFYHDPLIAGWWMWGQSSWIGSGWCSGKGAWTADADGRIFKQARAIGREAGVKVQRPHIGDDGRGVNRPQLREAGVDRNRPHIGDDGQGVNRPQLREAGVGDFHPMTMPELLRWFEFLSARLRHVRILNGDWKRACTGGASKTIPVRMGKGICGVFFDPPYADTAGRVDNLYAEDSLSVAHDVREWCVANGNDKDYRIALAGFDGEHNDLEAHGWTVVEWFKAGFLTGGMANTAASDGGKGVGMQQKKERLWLSPHCLTIDKAPAQGSLL